MKKSITILAIVIITMPSCKKTCYTYDQFGNPTGSYDAPQCAPTTSSYGNGYTGTTTGTTTTTTTDTTARTTTTTGTITAGIISFTVNDPLLSAKAGFIQSYLVTPDLNQDGYPDVLLGGVNINFTSISGYTANGAPITIICDAGLPETLVSKYGCGIIPPFNIVISNAPYGYSIDPRTVTTTTLLTNSPTLGIYAKPE